MPINDLVSYCLANYTKNGKCQDCGSECVNCCNSCLETIHNNINNLRKYDCPHMVNCYVCSYNYKYASEIYYIFNALVNHPGVRKKSYNILSIGCGGSSDIFGINHFLTTNQRAVSISYTGIEKNERWINAHQQIKNIFDAYDFDFVYQDAFDFLETIDSIEYNVVVLQYVLNEIIKHNTPDDTVAFIDKLVEKIVDKLPASSLIIFNDINHKFVRDYYPVIKQKVAVRNNIADGCFRFRNPVTHTYGGVTLQNDSLVFQKHNDARFRIKEPCSSSIYIIYKQ